MRARHVIGVAIGALAALAGCRTTSPAVKVTANANTPITEAAALPKCADVFRPGKVVDKAKIGNGCTSPSGGVHSISGIDCTDGTVLWQVDATTGAPAGYARQGKPYVKVEGDVAADKGYKQAYDKCQSDTPAKAETGTGEAMDIIKLPGIAVEVTAASGVVQATASTTALPTTPATPAAPEVPESTPEATPVPGGEWAHAPSKPASTPTADPA